MKRASFFMFIFLLCASVQAGQLCVDIPEGLSFQSVLPNYDKSITYENPKLLAANKMLRVAYGQGYGARGICSVLGKTHVTSVRAYSRAEDIVVLNESGALIGFTKDVFIVDKVVCK